MIQENLMNMCKEVVPDLTWTIDFQTAADNTGAVYSTGGAGRLTTYDMGYRRPTYQVFIRSSDWDFAKTAAEQVFELLHNKRDFIAEVAYQKDGETLFIKRFFVFLITAMSDPIRVGENEGVMEYSVNFDVTLKDITKGEILNA